MEWADRYRAGETLNQIAATAGCTREWVRQVLKKAGVSRKEGGVTVRAARRIESERAERAALAIAKRARQEAAFNAAGTSRGALNAWPGNTWHRPHPWAVFYYQRAAAKNRGIAWEFTFPEWWGVWERSGKWTRRGRRASAGDYVMARFGDTGPYNAQNVEIAPALQNAKDSVRRRGCKKGLHMGKEVQ